MSLVLSLDTKPEGLEIKTHPRAVLGKDVVLLGDCEISMADFLLAAHYVLTNTDLEADDLRPQFVECIKKMSEVEGHNEGEKRLSSTIPAVLP